MTTHSFKESARLAVIGAGPKALAIGLKVHVLKELGFRVPEVTIFEKSEVAAHWTGRNGFTNGKLTLGTSPEKDLGFPYETSFSTEKNNREINERLQNYSWRSYLVRQKRLADWVDRDYPAPTHADWGAYMKFVAGEISGSVRILRGEVLSLRIADEAWKLDVQTLGHVMPFSADGVVLTGPAHPKLPQCMSSDRIMNMESVWALIPTLPKDRRIKIGVVGNGETAASILVALKDREFSNIECEVISPHGALFTRGESFTENRFFSSASQMSWKRLSRDHRREFIRRTDIGVFSPSALNELRREEFAIIPGRVTCALPNGNGVEAQIEYDGATELRAYDYLVFASGLDHMRLLEKLLGPQGLAQIAERLELSVLAREDLESRIESDMSVRGVNPKLHLPMLSGLEQGPGFANLSCLGALADRVLESYVAGLPEFARDHAEKGEHETRYRVHTA